jgi:autotransporter strand-loop-strand O-heptosyltransferase
MIKYNLNYVDGLYFEIISDGGKNKEYSVSFVDQYDKVIYETVLKPNAWAKLTKKYIEPITIKVATKIGTPVLQINVLNEFVNKKVFISFESKSLGDTLAWIPYCLEFKNKYNCRVVVSTFHNELFETVYPELQFVGRGKVVNDIIGMFHIGWFWEKDREPKNPCIDPLQKTITNILHLPYEEILPRLAFVPIERPIEDKYVVISTKSTSQLKHWYYWEQVIDYLKLKGYQVVEMSLDTTDYKGLTVIEDKSIKNTMNVIHHAEFFIGLSSGLSWLAWALKKKVVMIANFTESDHEFTTNCIRITDESVCNSCWNNPKFKFNKGDWNWCPEHEDTSRQFECHKSIKAEKVIEKLEILMNIKIEGS